MMYYYVDVPNFVGIVERFIIFKLSNNHLCSFQLTDNDNPNKSAYDQWVAEGNEPEEWTDGN